MKHKEECCRDEKACALASTKILSALAIISLLLGCYGIFRTGINLVFFAKYPIRGTYSIGVFNNYAYQREEDCFSMYAYPDPNITQEVKQEQITNCVSTVTEARRSAKIYDITTSLFFLAIGFFLVQWQAKLWTRK